MSLSNFFDEEAIGGDGSSDESSEDEQDEQFHTTMLQ